MIVELSDGAEHHDVGVVVDAVNEVTEIATSEVEPAPSFGAKIRTDFIAGMGKVGKFVIILNIGRVLSLEDLAKLQAAAHTTAVPEMLASCTAQASV